MKKSAKRLLVAVVAAACLCAAAAPAFAACGCKTLEQAGVKPTREYVLQNVCGSAFTAPGVSINAKTNTITGVVDCNGNPLQATLSTDGHFYIVPTNTGNMLIGTGR